MLANTATNDSTGCSLGEPFARALAVFVDNPWTRNRARSLSSHQARQINTFRAS